MSAERAVPGSVPPPGLAEVVVGDVAALPPPQAAKVKGPTTKRANVRANRGPRTGRDSGRGWSRRWSAVVVPLGVDRCRVIFDSYYDPVGDDAKREADLAFSDEVQHEDLGICEDVQRGFASGSYVPGRLNPLRETGVHHVHELLRAAYRADA